MTNHFEPFTEEKVWGSVQHIFGSPHAGVSCLVVKKGFRCSLHRHIHRGNLFNVLEGCIVVEEFGSAPEPTNKPIKYGVLSSGSVYSVSTLVWHRFRVVQSGRMVEVYWNDRGPVSQTDIIRVDQGCADDWEELTKLYMGEDRPI